MIEHNYSTHLVWQGSTGAGYRTYSRTHQALAPPAAVALGADPHFRGEGQLLNPEQLLVMATSFCQLLSLLCVAALRHIDVVDYADDTQGFMPENELPMRITRIKLSAHRPVAEFGCQHHHNGDVRMTRQLCDIEASRANRLKLQGSDPSLCAASSCSRSIKRPLGSSGCSAG